MLVNNSRVDSHHLAAAHAAHPFATADDGTRLVAIVWGEGDQAVLLTPDRNVDDRTPGIALTYTARIERAG